MQFKIRKELINGRYYVSTEASEFTEIDNQKIRKFGAPALIIINGGANVRVSVTSLRNFGAPNFETQAEADEYVENLKSQISELKSRWNNLEDNWSDEEVL